MRFYDEILSIRQQIGFREFFVPRHSYDNIVICGMGGSAIAGYFLQDLYSSKPVMIANGYDIPEFVNERTLFFAISHSGNTEETLSAVGKAAVKEAQLFFITSGGKLATLQGEKIIVPSDIQPRSAIGYMLVPLLRTFGLFDGETERDTLRAIDLVFSMEGEIREIAESLNGGAKLPLIYGVPPAPTAAYRWKTQFNENSKIIAHSATIPEMNHNELAAMPHAFLREHFEYFVAGYPRGRYLDRVRLSESIAGVKFHMLPEIPGGPVPEMFSAIVYGDLLSYHLAESRKIDAKDVSALTTLKSRLAETGKS